MSKWINILLMDEKPKTKVWRVETKQKPITIVGFVKWYPQWRKYAYFPFRGTLYEQDCLRDITKFIKEETYKHKTHTPKP